MPRAPCVFLDTRPNYLGSIKMKRMIAQLFASKCCQNVELIAHIGNHRTRGLRSRAHFERDEMRRDLNSFPELAVPGRD